MPFVNRPPSPLFARRMARPQREAREPVGYKKEPTEPLMRMFPLESGDAAHGRSAAPLSHRGREGAPAMRGVVNALGQVMPTAGGASPYATAVPSSVVPPQPGMLPSPQNAVEQFARANKGLPDGVRYEPLDEETLKLLRENGHLPGEDAPAQEATASLPAMPDERPSQHFFQRLAQGAEDETAAAVFTALAKECEAADVERILQRVYEKVSG